MKKMGIVSWKLPLCEMSCQHFRAIFPQRKKHIYSTSNICFNFWTVRGRYFYIWHACLTNDTFLKRHHGHLGVNDLMTLLWPLCLKKFFSNFIAAGGIVFHKHILLKADIYMCSGVRIKVLKINLYLVHSVDNTNVVQVECRNYKNVL